MFRFLFVCVFALFLFSCQGDIVLEKDKKTQVIPIDDINYGAVVERKHYSLTVPREDFTDFIVSGAIDVGVPASSYINVTEYIDSSLPVAMSVVDIGYLNLRVRKNFGLNNKSYIKLIVRFASGSEMQNTEGDVLPFYIMSSDMAAAEQVIISDAAGSGLGIYTFCGDGKPACRTRERINKRINDIRVLVDTSDVIQESYTGTLTFELVTNP